MPSIHGEGSLAGTIDGTNPTAGRTRQDNLPTTTIDGDFTEAHKKALEQIDRVGATIDFIKISGGACYTGKSHLSNGRQCISFTKFVITFKQMVFRSVAKAPAQTDAVNQVESIFKELRPGEEHPEYITVFNELVFDTLLAACDEEALNIVLRYTNSDDKAQIEKRDGRRAFFALMQTYDPVSTNAGNNAKAKLEIFRFKQDKDTIQDQITNVSVLVQNL